MLLPPSGPPPIGGFILGPLDILAPPPGAPKKPGGGGAMPGGGTKPGGGRKPGGGWNPAGGPPNCPPPPGGPPWPMNWGGGPWPKCMGGSCPFCCGLNPTGGPPFIIGGRTIAHHTLSAVIRSRGERGETHSVDLPSYAVVVLPFLLQVVPCPSPPFP